MIKIGTDLVEIKRIEKSLKNKLFIKRIFSEREQTQLALKNFKPESVAANFCAKEAVLKSLGLGLGAIKLSKIELLRKKSGEPYITINDEKFLSTFNKKIEFTVSVTHTKSYALATVFD